MNLQTLNLLHNISCLLVEDDKIASIAIEQSLKPYCKNFLVANDGEEGLKLYKQHFFDMIITDINLPKINGFEMIREILSINPMQHFIVITSYDTDDNILTSIKEGAYIYMRKPLSLLELQTHLIMFSQRNNLKDDKIQLSKDIVLCLQTQIIYKNNQEIFLSPKLNKIFWLLYYNKNNIVSYDMIISYVYNDEETHINTIRMALARLKKQIGNDLIQNISNIGYILKTNSNNTSS
ncbi:response regulator transcription factor [Helicobacter sp. 11S03491-1]|uniref:response regulator transcription factor n=1 Tax=Helicobacter sp. 11S03491-1 TaxID=1476196 RepID=UPI000BA5662C|nr:response regulator transcription factor [Helicobacter sp. 11S03491-1]PAF43836.1 hypothetical protein BKH45_00810 [Helicobacter sp. 11S03491-1]